MERKLASIRKIAAIDEIPGADVIVKATVDGWQLVTQKSNGFKPGDLVVYFEIDSLLPICDQFSFLEKYRVSEKNSVNGEGYRLRTIKLRGQISQGLILPIKDALGQLPENVIKIVDQDTFTPGFQHNDVKYWFSEGTDLTELLNIKKYEKPIPAALAGRIRGNFPLFVPKTDQERIQNIFNDIHEKYGHHLFEVTVKLDGSSMTVYKHEDVFGVCSRNLDLLEDEGNAFWQVARRLDLENKLPNGFAIQGELMGPGVQGNREGLPQLEMFVFDVYDITNRKYLDGVTRRALVESIGLTHAPIVRTNLNFRQSFATVQDVLDYAERPSYAHAIAEGVVFKSLDDSSVSFKAISQTFLLKED